MDLDWSPTTLWLVAAGLLVAAELLTNTFYLLMLAAGAAAGALVATLGGSPAAQWLAAAVCGTAATLFWHRRQQGRKAQAAEVARNPDVNIDVGQPVQVLAWDTEHEGRAHYRGSHWRVRAADPALPRRTGDHIIEAVQGNWLVVRPR